MECSPGPSTSTGTGSCPDGTKANDGDSQSSHSETVQALRKYLLRKMSSEDSSGDKETDGLPERVISVAESNGSKLYCSLVQRSPKDISKDDQSTQGIRKGLAKHKSLDLDDDLLSPAGLRYLRTDLCIPVLWSKCSFCGTFFESEEELRQHLRDFHSQYFTNYYQMRPLTTTKSLSDLPFSSSLQIRDSPPPQTATPPNSMTSLLPENSGQRSNPFEYHGSKWTNQYGTASRKPVKCEVCGKHFSTKWNCKQHLKGHFKDSGGVPPAFGLMTSSNSKFSST